MNGLNNLLVVNTQSASSKPAARAADGDGGFHQLLQDCQGEEGLTQAITVGQARSFTEPDTPLLSDSVAERLISSQSEPAATTEPLISDDVKGSASKKPTNQLEPADLNPLAMLLATGLPLNDKQSPIEGQADGERELLLRHHEGQRSPLTAQDPLNRETFAGINPGNGDPRADTATVTEHPIKNNAANTLANSSANGHFNLSPAANSSLVSHHHEQGGLQNETTANSAIATQQISQLTAHTQSTTPTASPPVVTLSATLGSEQWQDAFKQQIILFNRQDIQQAEIKLHPEELGSLHIKLAMNGDKMQLHMAAAHAFVKGVLESALPHLRVSLAEHGIDLQDVNVSDFSMTNGSGQQTGFAQSPPAEDDTLLRPITESELAPNQVSRLPGGSLTELGLSVFV